MATLFKNANSPVWRARYFDASGKRVSKTTGTTSKREAQRIAAGYELDERDARRKADQLPKQFAAIVEAAAREAVTGDLTLARTEELIQRLYRLANPDAEIVSLRTFWLKWIEDQRPHVAASTASGYEDDFAVFEGNLGPKIMNEPINRLTKDQISAALQKARNAGGRKGSTLNKALSSLRRVMDAAVAAKLATHNPAKQARPLSTLDTIDRAPFSLEEVQRMLGHHQTSEEWKGAITIAAHTGLRLGDLVKLSRSHVDGNRIVIKPGKTDRFGKVITIPLTPPCIAWIGQRKGAFFPVLKSQNKATTSMQFTAIMERANVPRRVTLAGGIEASRSFHSLRHTFSSWLADANVHTDVRQKLTGHSSSKIHSRYTHHDEALNRAINALPSLQP